LEEAAQALEFELLTPSETPTGATLVDILEARGAIVQRYTLPEGGSFTVAQGVYTEKQNDAQASAESQTVEVRGTTGNLITSEDGSRVLLTWIENGIFYSVAGDINLQQALGIAESLQ
jgi:hypothetical protein